MKNKNSAQKNSFASNDCIKFDDHGYKIIFKKMFDASQTLLVLRENLKDSKLRFDKYFLLDCNFIQKEEEQEMENLKLVHTKEFVIFHYMDTGSFSMYYEWKK